jgi:endonuclease YncB( thermonuclease family)
MLRGVVMLAVLFAGGAAFSGQSFADPIASNQFTVTDGDTIRVIGERKGTRLVGFNAPETRNAKCARESELGKRATNRLKELVTT